MNIIFRGDEMISQHAPDLFPGVADLLSGTPGERKSSDRHPQNEDLPASLSGRYQPKPAEDLPYFRNIASLTGTPVKIKMCLTRINLIYNQNNLNVIHCQRGMRQSFLVPKLRLGNPVSESFRLPMRLVTASRSLPASIPRQEPGNENKPFDKLRAR